MRQRKARDMENRLQACSEYMLDEIKPEVWDTCFPEASGDLYLEIGCGKGQFIIKKALENPDKRFVAIEGQETVILRALEKTLSIAGEDVVNDKIEGQTEYLRNAIGDKGGKPIKNLMFACTFVNDMQEFFEENQLAGLYLNFSDPWPKARHARRRLTHADRMRSYAWAVRPGGFIEFKTDNDGLFEFTLEQIAELEAEENPWLHTVEMTRDLHASEYESKYTMTEYEAKFSGRGKNINYVKVVIDR